MEKSIKTQKLRTTKGNNNKDANKCFKKTKQDVFQMKISSRNCIVLNVFRQKKKKKEEEEEEDAPSGFESSPVQNMEKKKKTKQPLIFYVHN
jgi:hypothetical protein